MHWSFSDVTTANIWGDFCWASVRTGQYCNSVTSWPIHLRSPPPSFFHLKFAPVWPIYLLDWTWKKKQLPIALLFRRCLVIYRDIYLKLLASFVYRDAEAYKIISQNLGLRTSSVQMTSNVSSKQCLENRRFADVCTHCHLELEIVVVGLGGRGGGFDNLIIDNKIATANKTWFVF